MGDIKLTPAQKRIIKQIVSNGYVLVENLHATLRTSLYKAGIIGYEIVYEDRVTDRYRGYVRSVGVDAYVLTDKGKRIAGLLGYSNPDSEATE